MYHSEFIQKFEQYKPVAEFHATLPGKGFKETADKFGISPLVAAAQVRFVEAHKNDPKCEILGDATHYIVLKLSATVDLSNPENTRKDLVSKYKASDLNGPLNKWPEEMTKSQVVKLLNAFNIKWFYLNGEPFVDWREQ